MARCHLDLRPRRPRSPGCLAWRSGRCSPWRFRSVSPGPGSP